MKQLALRWLSRRLAARAQIQPYPGWYLGRNDGTANFSRRLRWRLWHRLQTPFAVRWLKGLRVYLYPNNETSACIFYTGLYEPNEFLWLDQTLQPGMTLIDVGANMGLYTLFAAQKVGPTGAVLAIEPSARELKRLRDQIALNRLTNVRVIPVAVSESSGEAELFVADDFHSGHNTLGGGDCDGIALSQRERVKTEPLDQIVRDQGLRSVHLIKIDIEGAEVLASKGARGTIDQFRPQFLVEVSQATLRQQSCDAEQLWQFFHDADYCLYRFDASTGLPVPAQTKYFGTQSENIIALPRESEKP